MNIPRTILLRTSADVRNEQAGDWVIQEIAGEGENLIAVSVPLKDPRHRFLIQLHEMVEAVLCAHRGVTDQEVTEFDAKFETERAAGKHSSTAEDGDDSRAPYRKEHFCATNIERLMAAELGVDWQEYEQAIADYFHA